MRRRAVRDKDRSEVETRTKTQVTTSIITDLLRLVPHDLRAGILAAATAVERDESRHAPPYRFDELSLAAQEDRS
jgi:hypothetical protein